jgi:hypothetical protein
MSPMGQFGTRSVHTPEYSEYRIISYRTYILRASRPTYGCHTRCLNNVRIKSPAKILLAIIIPEFG